ncbi:hypothetical protein RRG08_010399 [Elysia crispata]|uniref:Uncharacterized protein n=1 Tax=Elysia crispata TaxID=231223 RepID=A0AAE1BAF0_9GAST|nr:hypothetical protein RRG08_010399 [Elysia crispata]
MNKFLITPGTELDSLVDAASTESVPGIMALGLPYFLLVLELPPPDSGMMSAPADPVSLIGFRESPDPQQFVFPSQNLSPILIGLSQRRSDVGGKSAKTLGSRSGPWVNHPDGLPQSQHQATRRHHTGVLVRAISPEVLDVDISTLLWTGFIIMPSSAQPASSLGAWRRISQLSASSWPDHSQSRPDHSQLSAR